METLEDRSRECKVEHMRKITQESKRNMRCCARKRRINYKRRACYPAGNYQAPKFSGKAQGTRGRQKKTY